MKNEKKMGLKLIDQNGELNGGFIVLNSEKLSKIKGGLKNSGNCENSGECYSTNTVVCTNTNGCAKATNTGTCRNR